ncbi:MAG: hypothetical protein WD049_03855 [Candidatus Paceibacterota bacterium]
MPQPELPEAVAIRVSALSCNATEPQRALMEQLAERRREPNGGETAVEDLVELGEERQAAVNFFKELEAAGAGKFLPGRRGHSTRIKWESSGAIEVAKTFINSTMTPDEAERVMRQAKENTAVAEGGASATPHEYLRTHSLHLRPDLIVSIELPIDLTKEEGKRLAKFVRSIPF